MATVEQLTKWRAELIEARASGVRTLRHQNGQEITYKSDSEMAAAIRSLDSEIASFGPRCSTVRPVTSKGL